MPALLLTALLAATSTWSLVIAPRDDARPSVRSVQLEWTPSPGCPAAASLSDDLATLSGGSMRVASRSEARVIAVSVPHPDGFEVSLTVEQGSRAEHRTLTAPDCDTLARAVVLITAVTLAPVQTDAVLARSREATVPEPPGPTEPELGPTSDDDGPPRRSGAADARPARDRPDDARRLLLGAFAGPGLSLVPSPTLTVGGDLGWRWGAWSLHLRGWHALAATGGLSPGIDVRASLSAGGLQVRHAFAAGPVAVPLSLGLDVGALVGHAKGERIGSRQTASPWVAATGGLGLAWPAQSRVAAEAQAEVVLPLARPGIHVSRAGAPAEAFRVPSVGARAIVGIRVRLP